MTITAEPIEPSTTSAVRRWAEIPLVRELSLLLVAGIALFFVPYVVGSYFQQIGFLILQLVALSTAWNLLAGYTGMVSLGSAAFVGLGIYTVAELNVKTSLPLGVAFLASAVVAGLFAVIVSPAMFRLRGLYFTIGTLALAEALRIWMVNSRTFGGASGIFLEGKAPKSYELYWLALAIAVLATATVLVVLRSPLAVQLHAVRDDEDVAKQMGVFTFRVKLWAFVITAALMGVVGGVQALNLGVVEPYGSYGLGWTVDIVTVTIIGGMGFRFGPWVGAVFVVVLGEMLKGYAELHLAITGVILLLVIRFAPHGLWGSAVDATRRARSRRVGSP